MMYITNIRLRDVRCFEDVEIDLRKGKPGTSVLIAGNNGIGKSAILRAVAMGLCDRDSAASLLRELEGNFINRSARKRRRREGGDKQAVIEIELSDEHNKSWMVRTTVAEWAELIIERVEQHYFFDGKEVEFREFSGFWNELFVTAYGAGLRTTATAKFSDYFAPDALYSLFRYDAPLQDPEIAWRRLVAASRRVKSSVKGRPQQRMRDVRTDQGISKLLKYVLDLDSSARIVLEPNGIYVKQGREMIPLDALGDGHKALIKLTLDILVWYLLKNNYDRYDLGEDRDWFPVSIDKLGRPDVRGIVVIDEVEQHLHPKLQRQILMRLRKKFPKVQFIITTHSPLCISGTADVSGRDENTYRVFSLFKKRDDDVQIEERPIPRGLTADQILIDYFDLPTTINVSLESQYKRLRALLLKSKRSKAEEREFQRLKISLRAMAPTLGETIEEREMLARLEKNTEELVRHVRSSRRDKA
jgi:predicted ATPase